LKKAKTDEIQASLQENAFMSNSTGLGLLVFSPQFLIFLNG